MSESNVQQKHTKNGNSDNSPLRWTILGCGTISSNFVKALQVADRTHQVTVIGSSSQERAEEFKRRLNLAPSVKIFGSYKEALGDDGADIVYIGLMAQEHKELAIYAMEHGLHVLCEKPLGSDLNEVKEMVETARREKRFLMEGYWSRFFPAWQTLRSNLKEIGDIQLVQSNMCFNKKSGDLSRPVSASDLKLQQQNVTSHPPAKDRILFSAGAYTVMFALWVFENEMPEKITAVGELDEEGNDIWGNVTLEFSGNRVATLFYSGLVNSMNSALVAGTNGSFKLPDRFWCSTELVERLGNQHGQDKTHIFKFHLNKESKGFDYANGNAFYLEADHVFDCIKQGKTESEVMPLEESLRIAFVMDAIKTQIHSCGSKKNEFGLKNSAFGNHLTVDGPAGNNRDDNGLTF